MSGWQVIINYAVYTLYQAHYASVPCVSYTHLPWNSLPQFYKKSLSFYGFPINFQQSNYSLACPHTFNVCCAHAQTSLPFVSLYVGQERWWAIQIRPGQGTTCRVLTYVWPARSWNAKYSQILPIRFIGEIRSFKIRFMRKVILQTWYMKCHEKVGQLIEFPLIMSDEALIKNCAEVEQSG